MSVARSSVVVSSFSVVSIPPSVVVSASVVRSVVVSVSSVSISHSSSSSVVVGSAGVVGSPVVSWDSVVVRRRVVVGCTVVEVNVDVVELVISSHCKLYSSLPCTGMQVAQPMTAPVAETV